MNKLQQFYGLMIIGFFVFSMMFNIYNPTSSLQGDVDKNSDITSAKSMKSVILNQDNSVETFIKTSQTNTNSNTKHNEISSSKQKSAQTNEIQKGINLDQDLEQVIVTNSNNFDTIQNNKVSSLASNPPSFVYSAITPTSIYYTTSSVGMYAEVTDSDGTISSVTYVLKQNGVQKYAGSLPLTSTDFYEITGLAVNVNYGDTLSATITATDNSGDTNSWSGSKTVLDNVVPIVNTGSNVFPYGPGTIDCSDSSNGLYINIDKEYVGDLGSGLAPDAVAYYRVQTSPGQYTPYYTKTAPTVSGNFYQAYITGTDWNTLAGTEGVIEGFLRIYDVAGNHKDADGSQTFEFDCSAPTLNNFAYTPSLPNKYGSISVDVDVTDLDFSPTYSVEIYKSSTPGTTVTYSSFTETPITGGNRIRRFCK